MPEGSSVRILGRGVVRCLVISCWYRMARRVCAKRRARLGYVLRRMYLGSARGRKRRQPDKDLPAAHFPPPCPLEEAPAHLPTPDRMSCSMGLIASPKLLRPRACISGASASLRHLCRGWSCGGRGRGEGVGVGVSMPRWALPAARPLLLLPWVPKATGRWAHASTTHTYIHTYDHVRYVHTSIHTYTCTYVCPCTYMKCEPEGCPDTRRAHYSIRHGLLACFCYVMSNCPPCPSKYE